MNNSISVIMANYNSNPEYLREALDSLLKQTYDNFEVIFVDDGSDNKEYLKVLDEFESKLDLHLYELSKNYGVTYAKNFGIEESDAQFFMSLDTDDLIDPHYMSKMLRVLNNNPTYAFAYCDSIYFGTENKRFLQPEYNFHNLLLANYIVYCSLFRRSCWDASGGYNLKNRGTNEDWEAYIRLGKKGFYGKHLAEPLFKYRVHEGSTTQSDSYKNMQTALFAYFVKEFKELYAAEWEIEGDKILSRYPDNFISLGKKELEEIFKNEK